ncbi:amino acid adenylation domain-containing protein [Flavobacteriaceae bacterium MAR_2009_75]|nr:amino acid adenylation domain-containing protein [Flavobacteriaceae bacterium MAR_2009_75]
MIYTLHQILEKAASDSPNKQAFRCFNDSITYRELDNKSNRLAAHLVNDGVKKGDRVGIYMNRCLETTIAVYGILKSGGAYVPIDPFAPISRVSKILNDCRVSHLVTTPLQNRKIDKVLETETSVTSIIGSDISFEIKTVSWQFIYSHSTALPNKKNILGNDLAFILYTSGSTGIPKGIMHTHYSALSLAKIMADTFDITSEDVFGNPAPLHFDPSTFGYFVAPLVKATTVIVSDAHLKMPTSLAAMIADEKISIWYSVPLMLIQLLNSGCIEKHDFSALRWVFFAGEVFVAKHLRALMQVWSKTKFTNLYGPAELILCTYYNIEQLPTAEFNIPIGNVWAETEFKILDSRQEEVKKGELGELAVRSATLMQGYWNNEQLTDKAFKRVKIAKGYEHIYYRTGDLVKENQEGELLFLGRNDRQIKLRGHRVELDEVEYTFLKNESVEEVAVVVLDKEKEAQELAAVIKLKEGAVTKSHQLRDFCKEHLPLYAIPTTIEIFADLPRTSSGKINRKEISNLLDQTTK